MINRNAEEHFFKNYTHIIIDEVHERDSDTDFVLLMTKIKSYKNLKCKVVLMSATIHTDLFSQYFAEEVYMPMVKAFNKVVKKTLPCDVIKVCWNLIFFYFLRMFKV